MTRPPLLLLRRQVLLVSRHLGAVDRSLRYNDEVVWRCRLTPDRMIMMRRLGMISRNSLKQGCRLWWHKQWHLGTVGRRPLLLQRYRGPSTLSVATRSRENVNRGGADMNGRRSHPLIPSHNQPGGYI